LIPIAISTVEGKCLDLCLYSIEKYAGGVEVFLQGKNHYYAVEERDRYLYNTPTDFGTDYNKLMEWVFSVVDTDGIIISNDDVVLTPYTYKTMMDDIEIIKVKGEKPLGLLTARSDCARPPQDIRFTGYNPNIVLADVVSPIFCYVTKEAFDSSKLPPINWFGDDVWCFDLNDLGFQHYVSRAYVHHVGSQTIGHDAAALAEDSREWLTANRPQYLEHCYGKQGR